MKNKIISIDAESNGLYGQIFAIAASVYKDGKYDKVYIGRCEINEPIDPWVSKNVIPTLDKIPVTNKSYESLLEDFINFYLNNYKNDTDIIVHMGVPVEARLFIDANKFNLMEPFDGPYPLIDISAYPEIGTSVDEYIKVNNITVPDVVGSATHNPVYDAMVACEAYIHYSTTDTNDII